MKRLRLSSNHEMLSLDANSRLADSSSATPVLKIVCPSLVRLDDRMQFRPALAASWTIKDDQRVFTFKLQEGATFHSGRRVTADAVARNYNRLFDSRVGSLLAADYAGVESIRATAGDTIEFRYPEPFPALLYHLAGRTHVADDSQTQPVGAGPFRVTDWVRGSHLTMTRFDRYWEPNLPLADEIVVTWAPDSAERLDLIERGEVDIVESVPAKAVEDLRGRGLLESASTASTRKLSLAFNCGVPPFDDARMRQAVAHAVDREAIVDTFFGGFAHVFNAAYAAGSPWAPEVDPIPLDLAKARGLVREAGYADGLTVRAVTTNVAPVPRVAEAVASDLSRIGVTLDIRGYDDPPWWPLIYLDTDWQVAFQGMGPRAHPDILFRREFMTDGSFNPAHYSNPDLDRLVMRARVTVDEMEQARLYREAQGILREDLPYLPLYATDALVGYRPAVDGFLPHPLGYWDVTGVSASDWP